MTPSLWGGRFSAPPAEVLKRFNDSLSFDRALLAEDVAGSIAWARALEKAGALTPTEARKLVRGLELIARKAAEDPASVPKEGHEDVHSYVEATLFATVGPVAGKLHTGRSRNDQVATDLRLWLKEAIEEARGDLLGLAAMLASRALEEAATALPGYTHMKRAEPVTFGHWALAYVEMLLRDADRLDAALRRGDECPLGAGALSGTPVAVNRGVLARSLGFARPTANSLDAVSDRDMGADYLHAAAVLLGHLSRLAEDLIFFSSDECRFVELPDALATGSSRMPQKKNPDVLELVRGHAGRAIGELAGFLALTKGIPLAYDKDLQLDKEPLFRTRETLALALAALSPLIGGLELDRQAMASAASDDRLLATALADALARRGVAFRKAHEIVGKRFAEAERAGKTLRELGPGDGITAKDLEAIDLGRVLAQRDVLGGTAPRRVAQSARFASARIARMARMARTAGKA
ncbi:MAG TPA: argininosuccinate lyase [Thermoanaerobaculia bacterium]